MTDTSLPPTDDDFVGVVVEIREEDRLLFETAFRVNTAGHEPIYWIVELPSPKSRYTEGLKLWHMQSKKRWNELNAK